MSGACGGDLRNETIDDKVREHSLAKVPVLLVVGRKEAEARTVSVGRPRGQANVAMGLGEAMAPDRVRGEAIREAAD